jgi:hypothetical protein
MPIAHYSRAAQGLPQNSVTLENPFHSHEAYDKEIVRSFCTLPSKDYLVQDTTLPMMA